MVVAASVITVAAVSRSFSLFRRFDFMNGGTALFKTSANVAVNGGRPSMQLGSNGTVDGGPQSIHLENNGAIDGGPQSVQLESNGTVGRGPQAVQLEITKPETEERYCGWRADSPSLAETCLKRLEPATSNKQHLIMFGDSTTDKVHDDILAGVPRVYLGSRCNSLQYMKCPSAVVQGKSAVDANASYWKRPDWAAKAEGPTNFGLTNHYCTGK